MLYSLFALFKIILDIQVFRKMLLSLVIPAYNEEKRLGSSLQKIAQYLATRDYSSEVIVVDDGSSDRTVDVAESLRPAFQDARVDLRIVRNPGNRGKGFSVRNGMLHARGDIAVFSDADLSSPITELDKLIAPIIAGDKDVVFGSRALSDSVISTHQSFLREMAGRSFNLIMRTLTGLNFMDTQCGFKAYHRKKTRPVFELQRISGFGFDVEVLFIAQHHGLRLQEMPVVWGNVEGTKVTLLSGLRTFLDLVTIRWNQLCGRYNPANCETSETAIVANNR